MKQLLLIRLHTCGRQFEGPNLVLSCVAGEGTPQCFLLTPKLLPDLPFTENVNVLQIMNGPHIPVSLRKCTPLHALACPPLHVIQHHSAV